MKVLIEGNTDQVADGCATIARALKASKSRVAEYQRMRVKKQREKQGRLKEQLKIVRRAFNLVRNDPAQKNTVNVFAKALGGSAPVTDEIVIAAKQIIAKHGER